MAYSYDIDLIELLKDCGLDTYAKWLLDRLEPRIQVIEHEQKCIATQLSFIESNQWGMGALSLDDNYSFGQNNYCDTNQVSYGHGGPSQGYQYQYHQLPFNNFNPATNYNDGADTSYNGGLPFQNDIRAHYVPMFNLAPQLFHRPTPSSIDGEWTTPTHSRPSTPSRYGSQYYGPPKYAGTNWAMLDTSDKQKIHNLSRPPVFHYSAARKHPRSKGQQGPVPSNYRCYKCNIGGHWVKDCLFQSDHLRTRPARSQSSLGFINPIGDGVGPTIPTPTFINPTYKTTIDSQQLLIIRPDLVCGLCNDLLTDAQMILCCGHSYCDKCVRKALSDSLEHECPTPNCHQKNVSTISLLPNIYIRNCVTKFQIETGYFKDNTVIKEDAVMDLANKQLFPPLPSKQDQYEGISISSSTSSQRDETSYSCWGRNVYSSPDEASKTVTLPSKHLPDFPGTYELTG